MSVDVIHTQVSGAPAHSARAGSTAIDPATGIVYVRRDDSTWAQVGGGVAGSDTHVQYNDGGAFAGSDDYTFDKTDTWTFGGVSNEANIKLGSGAKATIAAGQHLIDLGNSVGGAITTAAAVVLRLDGVGAIQTNGHTYFAMSGAGGNLFLRLNNTHTWYFGGHTAATYEWQTGTVAWRDKVTNAGEMFCQFSTGIFQLNHQAGGNTRDLQINVNHTVAPNAASNLTIVGQQDGTEDQWRIYASGNQTYLRMRSDQYVDLMAGGINTVATFTDVGIRLFTQDFMRFAGGFFALVNVENQNITGTRFCRANAASTVTYYAYGAGVNGNPLNVATDLAAGSSFYAYGADINHSAGSGTVGFWEYRDNGVVVSSMLLNGDIQAGNYTGPTTADLWISAGQVPATATGRELRLIGGDGNGTDQDGGDVRLRPGAPTGTGAFGEVVTERNIIPIGTSLNIGEAANSFSIIYLNSIQGGNDLDVNVDAGTTTSSGAGRAVVVAAGAANTTGAGGNVSITAGAAAGVNQDGGTITITPGAETGSGVDGRVLIRNSGLSTIIEVNSVGMAFFGGTPAGQISDYGVLTDSTTGTPGTVLNDVGAAFNQGTLNDNFATIASVFADIRANWQAHSLMA